MPQPPDVNLLTRYLLENPWPLGLTLLVVAGAMVWSGMREGLMNRARIGGVAGLAGAAVLLLGFLVVTPGEHARNVARQLTELAVQRDAVGAMALFADDAAFTVGSPQNPGLGRDFIESRLIRLIDRYAIESNTNTMLRGFTESSDSGVVHMACFTQVKDYPYPTASRWVVRVKRQASGEWKIVQLTCVAINGQTPPPEVLR